MHEPFKQVCPVPHGCCIHRMSHIEKYVKRLATHIPHGRDADTSLTTYRRLLSQNMHIWNFLAGCINTEYSSLSLSNFITINAYDRTCIKRGTRFATALRSKSHGIQRPRRNRERLFVDLFGAIEQCTSWYSLCADIWRICAARGLSESRARFVKMREKHFEKT